MARHQTEACRVSGSAPVSTEAASAETGIRPANSPARAEPSTPSPAYQITKATAVSSTAR